MERVGKSILQVLAERPQGVSAEDLHRLVVDVSEPLIDAEYIRPLSSPGLAASSVIVYSGSVAHALAHLLRLHLVQTSKDGRMCLTPQGKTQLTQSPGDAVAVRREGSKLKIVLGKRGKQRVGGKVRVVSTH